MGNKNLEKSVSLKFAMKKLKLMTMMIFTLKSVISFLFKFVFSFFISLLLSFLLFIFLSFASTNSLEPLSDSIINQIHFHLNEYKNMNLIFTQTSTIDKVSLRPTLKTYLNRYKEIPA